VRQHCAQCLTEVLTGGHETAAGTVLCSPCYIALWGPKVNGNRVSYGGGGGRSSSRRSKRGRAVWLAGPTFEVEIAGSSLRPGIWRRRG
jgi:hypothetical protein